MKTKTNKQEISLTEKKSEQLSKDAMKAISGGKARDIHDGGGIRVDNL